MDEFSDAAQDGGPDTQRAEEWLGLGEAARLLGVTPNTLRRWTDRGHVSSFTTPGGHRRFARATIEALLPPSRSRRPH
ncbi:MAG: helix-turn-helix domain-containing protein, partial [Candidatus Dormibacteraeota bacterium]|nr:helix-turn-helix domain-containing protein [Candidatus Dormibacteraeota bacterium]